MKTSRFSFLSRSLLVLVAAFAPTALAGCVVVSGGGGDTCSYGGETYEEGENFPAGDGCNSCQCMEDGSIGCTEMGCGPDVCDFEGETHSVGDTWLSSDGCNTCECMSDGNVGCTLMACPVCTYQGTSYWPGDTFSDGCNSCTCMDDGTVACTDMACPACVYAGQEYWPGDTFPAIDGCNTCECTADGTVACTEIACSCDPQAEWWRDYVSTDPQECQLIDPNCPANTASFGNACGCGCEQSAECPQYFDCMPPNQCDVPALHEQCPYSDFAY